jgi:hypothetical protein
MWPGPWSPTTTASVFNRPIPPQPPPPDPGESQSVDRHLGLWCGCPLIECCHNEDHEPCRQGRHFHSGSPASGYAHPWEPDDESWRDGGDAWVLRAARR